MVQQFSARPAQFADAAQQNTHFDLQCLVLPRGKDTFFGERIGATIGPTVEHQDRLR